MRRGCTGLAGRCVAQPIAASVGCSQPAPHPASCLPPPAPAGPLANNITTFTAGVAASLPVRNVAAQLQSAAAVGHSSAVATVATVSAALESTWGRDRCAAERCLSASLLCLPVVPWAVWLTRRAAVPASALGGSLPPAGPRCQPCCCPPAPAAHCRLPKECQSPTEWFIADDEQQHVRIFVIQVGGADAALVRIVAAQWWCVATQWCACMDAL